MPILYLRYAAFIHVTRADLSRGILAAGRSNADGTPSPPRIARPRGLGGSESVSASVRRGRMVGSSPCVANARGKGDTGLGTAAWRVVVRGFASGAYTSSEETRGFRSRGVWKTPQRRAWLRRVRSVSGCGGPPHNRPRRTKN